MKKLLLLLWLLVPVGVAAYHFGPGQRMAAYDLAGGSAREAAALAGSGTAGLYGLRTGTPVTPAVAYWLSKPDGMGYAAFEASLAPLVAAGCALWGRRMTLGPTPEFCLHAPAARTLPHPAQAVAMFPVFGSSRQDTQREQTT